MTIENFTTPQMCSYTTLWIIVNQDISFKCRLFSDIEFYK